MARNGSITKKMIREFDSDFNGDRSRHVLKNAIIKNGIKNATVNIDSIATNQLVFSEEIETGKITSQKNAGTCWLFAGTNMLRAKVAADLKFKDFELSQTYLIFWDNLEKSNYFLENILETLDEDIYSRVIMWLLTEPIADGGQWDMFASLVEKYGVVPKGAMPENHHSSNSGVMNLLVTAKLREYASILRDMHRKGVKLPKLHEKKAEMLNEIYRMLVLFLGEPPKKIDFEYRDKDRKFFQDTGLTPNQFYEKYVKLNLDEYVSIINAPTDDKPYMMTYTVKHLGCVKGGREICYLNVDNKTLKSIAVNQLKDGEPVWFGCDVGQMMNKDDGILDIDSYLYEDALGVKFGLDKAGRLYYGDTRLTHAMVFTGVNLINGKPNRWKVENSWGDKTGQDGFLVMTDKWFDEHNFQIVTHKKYMSKELVEAYEQPPIVLPPWDPMGSLAK